MKPTAQSLPALLLILGIVLALPGPACRKSPTDPVAGFSFTKNCMGRTPCQVSFINQSEYAESFQWIFGDGGFSVDRNPVHSFTGGTYFIVRLWAIGREAERQYTDTVFINK